MNKFQHYYCLQCQMEPVARFVAFLLRILGILMYPFVVLLQGPKPKQLPPIRSSLLLIPAVDLASKIRNQEVKSEDIVRAYIERINEVNPFLNAVIEERFTAALEDARRADQLCENTSCLEVAKNFPLLGVPFTVKECCGLKGFSLAVASIPRKGIKALKNSHVVEQLQSAGAIPLLVSANPEYCVSWETNSLVNGRCNNPYDTRRTPGGSSGGEGALLGAGASLFGVASDLAGSIRIPALYNGIFGHKPTGELLSTEGHFPTSNDPDFNYYLQLGPMARYAKDLPKLLEIMAGKNAYKLKLSEQVHTKEIKIYYLDDAGFTFIKPTVDNDIKLSIQRAVEYFKQNGLQTQKAKLPNMQETLEISLAKFFSVTDVPDFLAHPFDKKKRDNLYIEILRNIIGLPKYSFSALFFFLIHELGAFIPKSRRKLLVQNAENYKAELLNMLGENGVLFYPTFHMTALRHNTSFTNLPGILYTMIFNIFGFPATHVPMGINSNGLPIGFQVVGAPYQDKLCLTIASELEGAFGGWVPASPVAVKLNQS